MAAVTNFIHFYFDPTATFTTVISLKNLINFAKFVSGSGETSPSHLSPRTRSMDSIGRLPLCRPPASDSVTRNLASKPRSQVIRQLRDRVKCRQTSSFHTRSSANQPPVRTSPVRTSDELSVRLVFCKIQYSDCRSGSAAVIN